ncbi:hypothetical protein K438DRAFT_1821537 [Mycena galopus ATCC 62051]|nr:hypothetical protein K438DRAFT_1821537 [Mycena galopus ATCC 62051]
MAETSSTSEAPPAKRQRVEEERLTRSDIWHDDGSLVLQVESTLFRVHWTILCMHSTFFRDMRDLPQPVDLPSIEGCPVIELHDSLEDVKHLLDALYNPHIFNQEKLSFPFIAALVRLGRKYDFKNLLEVAVQRLSYENPTTFEKYEALTQVHANGRIMYTTQVIVPQQDIIFDVLTLARENNLFAILPSAYLRAIVFYSPELIFDGIPSRNGSTVTLSSADQRLSILGNQRVLEAQWEHAGFLAWIGVDTPSPGCTDHDGCTRRKKLILQRLIQKAVSVAPFLLAKERGLCLSCLIAHSQVMTEARKEIWKNLPSFFDLPPWNELKNDI